MLERIKYFTHSLYERGNYRDIYSLAKTDHPLALKTLMDALESPDVSPKTRHHIYQGLLFRDEPQAREAVINAFQTELKYNRDIIKALADIHDERIINTLRDTLNSLDREPDTPQIITESMRTLAKLAPLQAIPVLEQVLEKFDFVSTDVLVVTPPHGLSALEILKTIDNPRAQSLYQHWRNKLVDHIQYHIEHHNIIGDIPRFGLFYPPAIGRSPELVRYILDHMKDWKAIHFRQVVGYLGRQIQHLDESPELQQEIVDKLYGIMNGKYDITLRRTAMSYLVQHEDERQLQLALDNLQVSQLLPASIKVLMNQQYTGAVDLVFDILDKKRLPSSDFRDCLKYLVMVGTEKVEIGLTDRIDNARVSRSANELLSALATIAAESDSAFESICDYLNHSNSMIRRNAISALGRTGLPAIGILISLLEGEHQQIAEALRALSSRTFVDALPYVAPFATHSDWHIRKIARKALYIYATEGAFAVLNTIHDQELQEN